MINSKIEPESIFSFKTVQYEDVLRKTKNLKVSKASQQSDIPTKISRIANIFRFIFMKI